MKKSTAILTVTAIISLGIGLSCLTAAGVQAATMGFDAASKFLKDLPVWNSDCGGWDWTLPLSDGSNPK